jgi:hypothetical protein
MASRFMYVVRVKISVKEEAEWNRWHDKVHIPKVLAQPGFLQVRKFRAVGDGVKEAEYFVLYELQNQAAYVKYAQSEEGANLRQEYLDAYGAKTKITRWAWQETLKLVKS